jgi:hypothetical protein
LDRSGTIFCPCTTEPKIKAKFDATRKDFQEHRKARAKKTTEKRKSSKISTILSTLLQDDDQLEQLKVLLTSKKAKTTPLTSQEFITFPTFLYLPRTDLASKPILPISVDTNLPHFLLPTRQPKSETAFRISVAYATYAVLNIGWVGFHLAMAIQYPHLAKSLIWAKDQYTPLIRSPVLSCKM